MRLPRLRLAMTTQKHGNSTQTTPPRRIFGMDFDFLFVWGIPRAGECPEYPQTKKNQKTPKNTSGGGGIRTRVQIPIWNGYYRFSPD